MFSAFRALTSNSTGVLLFDNKSILKFVAWVPVVTDSFLLQVMKTVVVDVSVYTYIYIFA